MNPVSVLHNSFHSTFHWNKNWMNPVIVCIIHCNSLFAEIIEFHCCCTHLQAIHFSWNKWIPSSLCTFSCISLSLNLKTAYLIVVYTITCTPIYAKTAIQWKVMKIYLGWTYSVLHIPEHSLHAIWLFWLNPANSAKQSGYQWNKVAKMPLAL